MKFADKDYIAYDPCQGDEGEVSCRTVKLVVARKEHACFLGAAPYGDGHTIKPGDRYRDEKALVDGDYWGRYKVCIPCMDKWLTDIGRTPVDCAPSFEREPKHPDDDAVDRFATAMKAKMAKQRAKGYGGWNDPEQCPSKRLQQMLTDHIAKGDPVDVGNFAMMLFNRGEKTAEREPVAAPVAWQSDALMQQALRACKTLPGGWIVSINMERGAGWCEIIDPTGTRRDELEAEVSEGNLAHELSQCIDAALASQAKQGGA